MSEVEIYRTQSLDDLDECGPGAATLTYYDGTPHRITFDEPTDSEGLYCSVVATYTADAASPFLLRTLTRYGEAKFCAYQYVQFKGFSEITPPESFKASPELIGAITHLATYLHDLLMFHNIDPESCTYVPMGGA
jgi:hypothetical protein